MNRRTKPTSPIPTRILLSTLSILLLLLLALTAVILAARRNEPPIPPSSTTGEHRTEPDDTSLETPSASQTVIPPTSAAPGTEPTAPSVQTQKNETNPPETTPPVTNPPVTDPPETIPPPVTEPPHTDPPVTDPPATEPPEPVDPVLAAIAALPNDSTGWGFGYSRDERNRPVYAVAEQARSGKYNADFLRETDEKEITLTFDCGYENGYTGLILDTLREKQVKAVFFLTMSYLKSEPELVQRMIDEGHIIGNHSLTHPAKGLPSLPLAEQTAEVMDVHEYTMQTFGYEMTLFRYPAGIYSEQSLALMQSLGYRSIFWSYAYADWDPANQPDPDTSLAKLVDALHCGAIYLLHAVSSTNEAILGDFIDQTRALGYEFTATY